MSCLARIENYYNFFTTSEKKIADYIIKNDESIVRMNIYELSAEIGTSPSSITRFVRKIDFNSFNEMKIELAKSNDESSIKDIKNILDEKSTLDTMCRKIVVNITSVCEEVLKLNSMDKFKETIEMLKSANIVYLFGVGASSIVAIDMQQKLMKLNKKCIYNLDNNFGIQNSIIASKEDVVVAISFSGRTKEVNLAVRRAKKNGTKCIAITKYAKSPLAEIADFNLYVPNIEHDARLAAIFSRYGQLFIVDTLFVGLAKETIDSPEDYLTEYHNLLELLKE